MKIRSTTAVEEAVISHMRELMRATSRSGFAKVSLQKNISISSLYSILRVLVGAHDDHLGLVMGEAVHDAKPVRNALIVFRIIKLSKRQKKKKKKL